jgi:hypothetical protein
MARNPGDTCHDMLSKGALSSIDLAAGAGWGAGLAGSIKTESRRGTMLWTIFVILLVLWLLGVVTSYTLGGFIHVLLIVAVILAIMQLISGRRAV